MSEDRILIGPVAALVASGAAVSGLQVAAFAPANFVGLAECLLAACSGQPELPDLNAAKARVKDTIKGDFGRVLPGVSPTGLLDGKIVGALQVVQSSPLDPQLEAPMVIAMFVHPDYQGKGIAATLLGHAASRLQLGGFDRLAIRVTSETAAEAVTIFQHAGFVDLVPGEQSA
jgi:GNAT superfamily N-acetyltransferase